MKVWNNSNLPPSRISSVELQALGLMRLIKMSLCDIFLLWEGTHRYNTHPFYNYSSWTVHYSQTVHNLAVTLCITAVPPAAGFFLYLLQPRAAVEYNWKSLAPSSFWWFILKLFSNWRQGYLLECGNSERQRKPKHPSGQHFSFTHKRRDHICSVLCHESAFCEYTC